jgi:sec-independent protein translocase protein TatA
MGTLSPIHWLIVVLVIVLLFGSKRIPELFASLGKGMSEFKKAQRDAEKDPEIHSKNDDKKISDNEKKQS